MLDLIWNLFQDDDIKRLRSGVASREAQSDARMARLWPGMRKAFGRKAHALHGPLQVEVTRLRDPRYFCAVEKRGEMRCTRWHRRQRHSIQRRQPPHPTTKSGNQVP